MTRRSTLALAAGGLALLAAAAAGSFPIRLTYNPSASAPRGWYAAAPADRLRVGDQVLAWPPPAAAALADRRGYVPRTVPLLKRVAATAGARVCRAGMWLSIDGHTVALARPRDRAGRPLPRWSGCRRLAADELLLLAAATDSFDGRYFGPVRRSQIIARVRPLWTW
ncbi:S26 family signal peptidase [Sphingomonas sp. BT-65]|uniref:S26 family signal peptidase n=1 Tax=Sphingomonas sp. BT-65 TaxID=2989821 RepID=UPI0022360EE1|nr:S26 family signal peptidase [Sphingomonas sp. BT-65]MCW4460804.1 S26 family signal peptidase [Sphingomonas sp. BT-65]